MTYHIQVYSPCSQDADFQNDFHYGKNFNIYQASYTYQLPVYWPKTRSHEDRFMLGKGIGKITSLIHRGHKGHFDETLQI